MGSFLKVGCDVEVYVIVLEDWQCLIVNLSRPFVC